MDLKQMEYFVRVAELGSFTRASIALDIAQPALSRQIRLFELELEQSLLVRNGRGVTTTDAGKLLLEHCRTILHQTERLREDMGRARGALIGKVALGMPPSLLKVLAVPILARFREQLPAATISIHEGLTASMQEGISSGRMDMALLYNATSSPNIDLTPLAEEELFLIAPHDTTLPATLPLRELPSYPLVMPGRPNALRMLIESELSNVGMRPTITVEIDGVNTILDLVRDGFGYAILTRNAVDSLSGANTFRLCRLLQPQIVAKVSLGLNAHRQLTATQSALMTIVREVAADKLRHVEDE